MARRPPLSGEPLRRSSIIPRGEKAPLPEPATKRPPSRVNLRAVTFWVSPEAKEQLRNMVFRLRRTEQDLGQEALDDMFSKYGMHRVSSVKPKP